jgi:TetR/AcrR family transcriptional repressor of nem operon
MRVSREQAAENRARILEAAARLFRERGLNGVGVDALGEAAGMTHGSLYSQFGSKEALAAEAVALAVAGSGGAKLGQASPGTGALQAFVESYLSPRHRDAPGAGCPFAAMGSEVPRQPASVRARFTEGLRLMAGNVAAMLAPRSRAAEEEALAVVATMIGAMTLARAVDDPALSGRILDAARGRLAASLAPDA